MSIFIGGPWDKQVRGVPDARPNIVRVPINLFPCRPEDPVTPTDIRVHLYRRLIGDVFTHESLTDAEAVKMMAEAYIG